MKGKTTVIGYDNNNNVIIKVGCEYNNRYEVINKILNTENVTHITTTTILER